MSTSPTSRPAFATPPTLADLLDRVLQDERLSPDRRRDVGSALRTLARALRREPAAIPANPRFLQAKLKELSPAAAGLSPRRWANVRSLVSATLMDAAITSLPGRRLTPLSPAWQRLYDVLPSERLRNALSRFIGACSVAGIEPDQVDDAVMDRYRDDLLERSLLKNPRKIHQVTCHCWNLARRQLPVWPQQALTVPAYRDMYALPWSTFPASLREDTERWLAVLSGHDILATSGPLRPLRPATIKTRRQQVHWLASALVHRGRDPATLRALADLISIDAVKDGLRFLLERHGNKPTRHLQNIVYALRSVAQWVGADDAHLAQLADLCRRLSPGAAGLTQKNRATLRQFDHPDNVDALLSLPPTLLARARRRTGPSAYAALDVQVAVAIELLLVAPVRIGNLASVQLGRNLVQVGRNGPRHLVFPSADVKNEEDLEFPLPAETTVLLDLYCRDFRPRLLRHPGDWLFPGANGKHKSANTLALQIQARIRAVTGLNVTPHQFRHIGAKLFLDANPGGYEVVKRVLGHRSHNTTTAFYCGAESAAAVRHFDAQILRLRSAGTTDLPARRQGGAATQKRRAAR